MCGFCRSCKNLIQLTTIHFRICFGIRYTFHNSEIYFKCHCQSQVLISFWVSWQKPIQMHHIKIRLSIRFYARTLGNVHGKKLWFRHLGFLLIQGFRFRVFSLDSEANFFVGILDLPGQILYRFEATVISLLVSSFHTMVYLFSLSCGSVPWKIPFLWHCLKRENTTMRNSLAFWKSARVTCRLLD